MSKPIDPICKTCGTINEIWTGSDGVLRYICPNKCNEQAFLLPVETLYGQKVLSREKIYVSHCWNCDGYVDSRLPAICPRDENHLFKCCKCGKSMKEFPKS